jgi:hypothetical protein
MDQTTPTSQSQTPVTITWSDPELRGGETVVEGRAQSHGLTFGAAYGFRPGDYQEDVARRKKAAERAILDAAADAPTVVALLDEVEVDEHEPQIEARDDGTSRQLHHCVARCGETSHGFTYTSEDDVEARDAIAKGAAHAAAQTEARRLRRSAP